MTGRTRLVIATVVWILVFAVLFPWGGCLTSSPPQCYGPLGPLYEVPDGGWPAVIAGVVGGLAVWFLPWSFARKNQSP